MKSENKSLQSAFVGMDIDKREIEICVLSIEDIILDSFRINNDNSGFGELIKRLPDNTEPIFALEYTGPYSGNLVHFLKKFKSQIVLCNPFFVSRLRDAFSDTVKQDGIDAYVLAQGLRMNVLKGSQKDEEYIYLQDILERYYDLVDSQTALTNQLRAVLIQTFPAVEKIIGKLASISGIVILSNYQTAEDLLKTDDEVIYQQIRKAKGKFSKQRITELKEECKVSVGSKTGEVHKRIVVSQVEELKLLTHQIKQMKILLKDHTKQFDKELNLLSSVPGVGDIISTYLLAIIGDHIRFDPEGDGNGASRLSSFVGYGVFEYSSGPRSSKRGISKRGNSRARGLLFMAATAAKRYYPEFKERYDVLYKRKGNGRHALTAISHSILRRCYGVLKSGRPYDSSIPKSRKKKSFDGVAA